jgi:hypothetical protein
MTMIRGVRIRATQCCGKQYSSPRYLSMNFMAFAFWTDGWRENSLMPNESGLRQCDCGAFVRLRDMIDIAEEDQSDLPSLGQIPGHLLQDCIERAIDEDMEILARFAFWRHANHPYRDSYKAHRDAEEEENKQAWDTAKRESQSWWKRALRLPTPEYVRSAASRFTVPPFDPSDTQIENMTILSDKLLASQRDNPKAHALDLAELYRELGRFEEAQIQINKIPENETGTTSKLIANLIGDRERALVRYRM